MVFIKRRWTLLVLSRFLIGFIPCYLHPDEFFQNPEVAAAYVLNNNAELPWEFHPEYPMRSMLPIFLSTGWLFSLAKGLGYTQPMVLYTLTRGLFITLSLLTDAIIYRLSNFDTSLLTWMTFSHVHLYLTHSFSNSLITFLLAVCLLCIWTPSTLRLENINKKEKKEREASGPSCGLPSSSKTQPTFPFLEHPFITFVLGAVAMLGVFTHPTFLLFGVPVFGFCGYQWFQRWATRKQSNASLNRWEPWTLLVSGVGGALVSAGLCIVTDSWVYQGKWNAMVITIFHFIHYNRDVANVSLHGFHPRYLHLLVHLPFLFGPMLLTSTVMSVVKRPFSFFSSPLHWKTPHGWLGVSVLSGLLSLSWIPHQEPRFLLPLYPLLLLLCRPHPSLRRKYSFIVMSVLIMVSLSGHQAGLIPCLLKLNDLPWLPLLVTWHTYMVPHFLLPLMPTTTTTTTSSWTSSRPPPSIQPMTLINLGSPPFPSSFPSPGNGTSHPPSFLHAFMKDPTHVPAFYFLAPFLPSTFPFSSSLSSSLSLSSMDPTVSSIPTDPKWYPEKVCTAYSISLDTPNPNEKHGYGVRLPFTTHVHLYRITQLNDSTQL